MIRKPSLTFALALLLLAGCSQDYTVSLSCGEHRVSHNFKAGSPEDAYRDALGFIDSLAGSHKDDFLDPANELIYTVTRGADTIIGDREPAIIRQRFEFAEQKKAFAGAEFGMSRKEVRTMPQFKTYKAFGPVDGYSALQGTEDIGREKYGVTLLFNEDRLVIVALKSTELRNANHLDGKILKEVQNLREVFERKYGTPTEDYGVPSILQIDGATPAYIWGIGSKLMQVGIQDQGPYYEAYALVSDNNLTEEAQAKGDERVASDAEKF